MQPSSCGVGLRPAQTLQALCLAAFPLFAAAPLCAAPAVTQSVEFPWAAIPRPLWESELVWLKSIGIAHVSLPQAAPAQTASLAEAVRIVRLLNLEADLEGPVPDGLQPQLRAHGGPLTETPASGITRISALAPDALLRSRRLLAAATPMILWTDVEDTLGATGFRAGAVAFGGQETPATTALRRAAQLSKYWRTVLPTLHPRPGGAPKIPAPGITAQQFVGENGASFVQAINASPKTWTGDLRVYNPALKHPVFLTGVTLPPHDSLWLPVDVPLTAGPLCKDCTAFATVDRLVSATAELTAMEYENGILALEFSAPAEGSVVLQVSHEPSGPLVAGGKPTSFDWDETTKHVRLPIPAGKGPGSHVRIGLAIDAPDATAFFDSARVLLIGETNRLTAQFSSEAIMQRSRLLAPPELHIAQEPDREPLKCLYRIEVPETAVPGDRAELAFEADGSRMSHVDPELMRPVRLTLADAISVPVGSHSSLPLFPATLPVGRRAGRDVTIAIRNNAPEIRSFHIELKAEGLEFSPEKLDVAVGASASRDISFRVFATGAAAGVHEGEVRVTEAAEAVERVRFVIIPPAGAVTWAADGFSFLESAKIRAAFLPGRWLEYLNKDNGQNAIPAGGVPFTAAPLDLLRLESLEPLLPKPKR
jgi:hypothetical protein